MVTDRYPKWIRVKSTDLISSAESLFCICPPIQSTHSTRKMSPGRTDTTEEISRCQRFRGIGRDQCGQSSTDGQHGSESILLPYLSTVLFNVRCMNEYLCESIACSFHVLTDSRAMWNTPVDLVLFDECQSVSRREYRTKYWSMPIRNAQATNLFILIHFVKGGFLDMTHSKKVHHTQLVGRYYICNQMLSVCLVIMIRDDDVFVVCGGVVSGRWCFHRICA